MIFSRKHKSTFLILAVFFVIINSLSAQDTIQPKTYKGELFVSTDNDVFIPWQNLDRYYTYGIAFSYRFQPEKFIGIPKWFSSKNNYAIAISLHQEGYTPSNKSFTLEEVLQDSVAFDRPFAGLLYGKLNAHFIFNKKSISLSVLAGVMGPASGADKVQKWYHSSISDDLVFDGWNLQIPNQFIFNIDAKYEYYLEYQPWLDFYGSMKAQAGNLYINTSPELGFRIGNLYPFNRSNAYSNAFFDRTNHKLEFGLKSSISITLEAFNATAQGNIFNRDYPYEIEKLSPFYTTMTHEIFVGYKNYTARFITVYNYDKVVPNSRHIFGTIAVSIRF